MSPPIICYGPMPPLEEIPAQDFGALIRESLSYAEELKRIGQNILAEAIENQALQEAAEYILSMSH